MSTTETLGRQQLPTLNFRRRIALLVRVRQLCWFVLPAMLLFWYSLYSSRVAFGGWAVALFGVVFVMAAVGMGCGVWEKSLRRQFIREASMPGFLIGKIRAAHPGLSSRDAELVLRGLRQFFMAHLRSDRQFVAMPSKVVDTAWHEYILHTKAYALWCDGAFGKMLHHTPAEVLGRDPKRNDGLRRSWYWACKEESIDPRQPTRLPLLFALDAKIGIEGGFRYLPDCRDIDREARSGTQCGSDFGGSDGGGAAGDADGFGGSESSGGDGGGDSSDGGCGGGCGGD